ncbi:Crp/Fnr family transcriptional regulator [Martelella mediterranea]|uniref:Putative signal-transduction protein containing cAMP-binding and CBS domain n=1 Tax=Martelella mediterranea DSM 17316 TaxID=1122214 RepID=A0A1U9YXX5_9HYPH|nr:cyclic nucleotide-binding domain-containing protein [Martelella mediterranea]AQZ50240.1 putative signal-transduction protein containing cAMP-binding and CBS domain [Martelella mediterranea DSM 17316]
MALSDDIATLRRAELFSGLSAEQLRLIAFTIARLSLDAGDRLFDEDQDSAGAYMLESGHLDLEAGGRSAGIAGPGSLLTEAALISPVPHRFAARASAPSELLLIRREQFLRLIEEYPDIGREMENRLRQSFADMVSALGAVKTRLSDF